jgi:hypothetical protein
MLLADDPVRDGIELHPARAAVDAATSHRPSAMFGLMVMTDHPPDGNPAPPGPHPLLASVRREAGSITLFTPPSLHN